MKTIITSAFVFLTVGLMAQGQNEILYDFNTKKLTYGSDFNSIKVKNAQEKANKAKNANSSKKKSKVQKAKENNIEQIESGKTFNVKVENINLMLYQVKIETKNQRFHADTPALFAKYMTLSSLEDIASALPEVAAQKAAGDGDGDDKGEKGMGIVGDPTQESAPKELDVFTQLYYTLFEDIQSIKQSMNQAFYTHIDGSASVNVQDTESILADWNLFQVEYLKNVESKNDSIRDKMYEQMEALEIPELLLEVDVFIQNFSTNRSYTSFPIQAEGDEMQIGIKVFPRNLKDTVKFVPLQTDSFGFKLPVHQKFRASFSTGLFASGLHHEQYTGRQVYTADTVSGYNLVANGGEPMSYGPTALAHFTWGGLNCRAGITTGVGLSIEKDPILQYFLGGSVLFGRKQRVGLNGLVSLGQVNQLSNSMDTNYDYPTQPEITYEKRIKASWGFAITYNLF